MYRYGLARGPRISEIIGNISILVVMLKFPGDFPMKINPML